MNLTEYNKGDAQPPVVQAYQGGGQAGGMGGGQGGSQGGGRGHGQADGQGGDSQAGGPSGNYQANGDKSNYFFGFTSVPVLARTVKTPQGSCFALSTKNLATVEQRYQGELHHLGWV